MPLTKDERENLSKGFLQLGLSVLLYLTYSLLGCITAILIGFILPEIISPYIQGTVILLTQGLSVYFSIKTLHSESSVESYEDR